MRVRSTGSTCMFENRLFINVSVGDCNEKIAQIILPDNIQAREVNEIQVISENNNLLYKFIVVTEGYYVTEQQYSPSDKFLWIPKKSAEYTIIVRIIDNTTFGYADTIIRVNTTIQ